MAQIDRIKELLNSLRVGLSIVVGLIVILTGAIINRDELDKIDNYFYIGVVIDILLLLLFIKIILSIRKNIEIIKDL